jgi:hypothetical protein
MARLSASDPRSRSFGHPYGESEFFVSSATLLPSDERIEYCVDRLNPQAIATLGSLQLRPENLSGVMSLHGTKRPLNS